MKEKCAVFGVSLQECGEVAGITYNALLAMQHRGQEGSGIAVVNEGRIICHKDTGLVSEVFKDIEKLPQEGRLAVGHNRYAMSENNTRENVGPFVTEYLIGRIVTAHNGNITNAEEIRQMQKRMGVNFEATCGSEVASSLIAYFITREKDTLSGVIQAAGLLRGAFSLVVGCGDNKLFAVRDSNGFRPLCLGKNENGIAVASESCALEICGFEFVRDIMPGEIVEIENGKIKSEGVWLHEKEKNRGLCIFEYVYFARPDSYIDGLSVHAAQFNMGVRLAQEYPVNAEIVCGVPDSGLVAASGFSAASGIPLAQGFVKNRYIGRSFISPTQSQRDSAVRMKLNPLTANIRGRKIVLVDDSIVRGTTSKKIVQSLKNAGAKEVHMRVSSPPFCYTCHYGTDIDDEANLIANKMSIDEIRQSIGADSIGFISVDGLKRACKNCRLDLCTACFTGND
jgi:amidophosphoribosyltransferase